MRLTCAAPRNLFIISLALDRRSFATRNRVTSSFLKWNIVVCNAF